MWSESPQPVGPPRESGERTLRLHRDAPARGQPGRLASLDDDQRLLERSRAGDAEAFATIIGRYRPALLARSARIVGHAAAEDAVQQTCIDAWRALGRGQEVWNLRGWLFTLCKHASLRTLPSAREIHRDLSEQLPEALGTGEQFEQRARARAALSALAQLSPLERDALVHTSIQGRSGQETALTLGVSEPRVRQLVHQARARLRATAMLGVSPVLLLRPFEWIRTRLRPGGTTGSPSSLVAGPAGGAGARVAAGVAAAVLAGAAPAVVLHSQGAGDHPRRPARAAATPALAAVAAGRRPTAEVRPATGHTPSRRHHVAPVRAVAGLGSAATGPAQSSAAAPAARLPQTRDATSDAGAAATGTVHLERSPEAGLPADTTHAAPQEPATPAAPVVERVSGLVEGTVSEAVPAVTKTVERVTGLLTGEETVGGLVNGTAEGVGQLAQGLLNRVGTTLGGQGQSGDGP